jgi:hypothetical protein
MWSEVRFVRVLWPVSARGLPLWATGVTWVVKRVSQVALVASFASDFSSFEVLLALPFWRI